MKMRRAIFAILFAGLCSAHAQPLSPPTDNPVMKAIVAEDQRVRLAGGEKDWTDAGDRERRSQTRRLLASGAIRTGKDTDDLRARPGVPPQEKQAEQLRVMQAQK